MDKENTLIEPFSEFVKLLGEELDRYDLEGNSVNSVECTEDNIINLYNSQFEDRTTYGEVYRYVVYKEQPSMRIEMSHTIIKSIRITKSSVIITGASDNVYPRTYSTEEAGYYSETLRTEGKVAVEKLILKQYFEGNFKGSGKYSFAVFRCLFHEKLERQAEWDKCKNLEYQNELLNKFHYYLKNPPKKQPCYIRHIKTGGLVLSVTTLLIRFDSQKYRIFSSVDAAQSYLHNTSMRMGDFEVIPIAVYVQN